MSAEGSLAAAGFALLASTSWGTSDFFGGLGARRVPLLGVMLGSYAVGLVLLVGLAFARREPLGTPADFGWAVAAGLAGSLGLTAQYRALAVGRMGLAAPVAAVWGAALPVAFSTLIEGLPGALQIAGFGCGLAAMALITRPAHVDDPRRGLGLALIAGSGFGVFFILIDRVSTDAVFWPLVAARSASLGAMLAIGGLWRGQDLAVWRNGRAALLTIALAGVLDVGGNTFYLLAAQAGRLDVAAVLSSLYPGVTVLLAGGVLHERLTRVQAAGVLAALIAIPLIAA